MFRITLIKQLIFIPQTSILQVLLKELPVISGNMRVNGTISYACQESWLFPATVRENILFGLPYEPARYKQVNFKFHRKTIFVLYYLYNTELKSPASFGIVPSNVNVKI